MAKRMTFAIKDKNGSHLSPPVLLGAAGLAWLLDPLLAGLMWGVLALVLWCKAGLEERWMCERHPQYSAYCAHSKRFLPWVY